jgi:hypothetical protein
MFFVNFLNYFPSIPAVFRHHNTYCSYADTIMPQFFFAVGFAYRLVLLRRLVTVGPSAAYRKVLMRSLGLILIGAVIYQLDGRAKSWSELQSIGFWGFLATAFQRNVFQALVHIGVTSLWVMPVIGCGPLIRMSFIVASAAAHVILSKWFYYDWVMNRPGIDGGPLGFLTWTIPLLVGSLAYDVVQQAGPRAVGRMVWRAVALMLAGYLLSCIRVTNGELGGAQVAFSKASPPFVPPGGPVHLLTMSQRAGSVSYQTFGAGFSLAMYVLFIVASDRAGFQLSVFRTFGSNALAGYVIHDLVISAIRPYTPKDSPTWYALATCIAFIAITYLFVRYLERNRIYIRL